MNNQETKVKKWHITPILVVIAASVAALILGIVLFCLIHSAGQDEMFRERYSRAEAVCTDKTMTSDSDGATYYIGLDFSEETYGGTRDYHVNIVEKDPRLEQLDVGGTIDVYYHTDDPNFCHPVFIYPDYTAAYITLAILIVICCAAVYMNMVTIIRNRHGYIPKFEKAEEIGYMGEAGADNGLSDDQRDYAAGDVFSNNLMDSYVDPFATYTGYDDAEAQQGGDYYDPNAFYTQESEPPAPYPPQQDFSARQDPFAYQVNNDPDNPYNTGSYEVPNTSFGTDNGGYDGS